jgi:hypothetical protein
VKPNSNRRLVRGIVVFGVVVLLGFCFRSFLLRQVRAYGIGLIEVTAEELGQMLPEVDEIEVVSLDLSPSSSGLSADTVLGYRVHARATVRGAECAKIAELWRYQRRGRDYSGMCHMPGYALRFRQQGKLIFETTVCWRCHNYSLPIGIFGQTYYGFDVETKQSKELLETLQIHAPLAPEPEPKMRPAKGSPPPTE